MTPRCADGAPGSCRSGLTGIDLCGSAGWLRGLLFSPTSVTLAQIAESAVVDLTGETVTGEPVSVVITLHWTPADVAQAALWSGTWTTRANVTSGPMPAGVAYDDGSVVELDCLPIAATTRQGGRRRWVATDRAPTGQRRCTGAVPLAGVTSVQTCGTALEAEEPNRCTEPLGRAAWLPGHPLRLVHDHGQRPDDGGHHGHLGSTPHSRSTPATTPARSPRLTPCNDWSRPLTPGLVALQPAGPRRFVAEPRTTYLVQVGGVSSDANDGSLRISVGSP